MPPQPVAAASGSSTTAIVSELSAGTNSASVSPEHVTLPKTRLQSGIRKEKVYTDGTVRYGCFTSSGEPRNLEEALNSKTGKRPWTQNTLL